MQPLVANYGYFPCSLHATFGWEIAVAPKTVCIQPPPENTSSAPKPVCMQPLMLNTSISHATCLQDLTGNIRLRATRQPCNCNRQFTTKPVVPVHAVLYHAKRLPQLGSGIVHGVLMIDPMQAGAAELAAWLHARMASFHARPHCDAAHASWRHGCHGPRNALPTYKSNNTCVCNTDNQTMRGRGYLRGERGDNFGNLGF
jgi:hypothetical protein